MTSEPVRHDPSKRNRRKALHHAKCLRAELEHQLVLHARQRSRLEYALGRACKMVNRLKAETDA